MMIYTIQGEMVISSQEAGMPEDRAMHFLCKKDLEERLASLVANKQLDSGDIILFKGSRGMRMETLVDSLKK